VRLVLAIFKMPKVVLQFDLAINQERVLELFLYFNSRHKKIPIFKLKKYGVALIDLYIYKRYEKYISSVSGKNSPAYYSRRASGKGYSVVLIDRNNFSDDIFLVNVSASSRQGRDMPYAYRKKINSFDDCVNYKYYGVLIEKKLVAYADVGWYGNFVIISKILGHADFLKDGVMYLLITRIVQDAFDIEGVRFVMYDTMLGGTDGLLLFKKKFLFQPYIADSVLKK